MWEILPLFVEYAQRRLQTFQRTVTSSKATEHSGWGRVWVVRTEGSLTLHGAGKDPPDPPVLKSTGLAENSQGTQRSLGWDEEDTERWTWRLQCMDGEHQRQRPAGPSRLGSASTKASRDREWWKTKGPIPIRCQDALLSSLQYLIPRKGDRKDRERVILSSVRITQ